MKTYLATFALVAAIASWSSNALAVVWHCYAWPGSLTSDRHHAFADTEHDARMDALGECEEDHGEGSCSVKCHVDHD